MPRPTRIEYEGAFHHVMNRGRYKSVLVDEDDYLLQLTRYIHLNPIETKEPMVRDLADYQWSSYPAYINKVKSPSWLCREKTYQMLGHKQRYKGYQNYIAQGVDEDIKRYYCHYNILSVLGSPEFKQSAIESSKETELDELRKTLINKPDTDEIIKLVCHYAKTNQRGQSN